MAKSSLDQIKKDELKIVHELKKNSDQSIDKIAKKFGFSRQKVWRIIKNLKNNNTIWGFTAIVDNSKLNLKKYFLLIKRASKPFTKDVVDKIIKHVLMEKLEKLDIELLSGSLTNGNFDFIICINAPNIKNVKRLLENLNKLFGSVFSEVQLIEELFCVRNCGIENPNAEQLKEFFS